VKEFNFDIWRLQAQSNVRGLLEALKSSEPTLRQRAAMALRVMGSASALPSLQDALLAETDKETRDIIIATLESLFSQEHEDDSERASSSSQVVQFIARLNSANPEHAIRAAQGLGDIQEKLAVEALMLTFNNRQLSGRVRLAAAEALIQLQSPTADISLLAALRSERWSVRRSAAAVLGQMDADWAVEPLIKALQDSYEVVRRTARAALERIATPEAKRALEAPSNIVAEARADVLPEKSPTAISAPPPPPAIPPETTTAPKTIVAPIIPAGESLPAPTPDQAPVATHEPPSAATSVAAPASSEAVPEVKTVIQPAETSHEPLLPATPATPSVNSMPVSPLSAMTTTVLPPAVAPYKPTGVEDGLVATLAPSTNLALPEKLPGPTEEDTRPTTPVPDDVS
jgi:HEAT repeats